jgi:co-chaperonin GroES (HSP10)
MGIGLQDEPMGEVAFVSPARALEAPLPRVTLWRILIEPYRPPTTLESGLALPDSVVEDRKFLTVVGQVVAMGEQAYQNPKLADSGNPKLGDWVVYGKYAGQLVMMADGREFRIMNDDEVLCTVQDPKQLRQHL